MKHWVHHRGRIGKSWEELVVSGHAFLSATVFFLKAASTPVAFKGDVVMDLVLHRSYSNRVWRHLWLS